MRLLFAGFLAAVCASHVQAQVKWDSPFLVPPRPGAGVGIFLMDADAGGVGGLITWQPTPASWGFRAGIVERFNDGVAAVIGADVSGAITRNSTNLPLDMDWVLGIGAGIADDVVLSLPLGITVGHTFAAESAQFTPYLTPRVILDGWFGDRRDEALDLAFAVDLGIDLQLQQSWKIRFGGTIGDREGIAIGIVF